MQLLIKLVLFVTAASDIAETVRKVEAVRQLKFKEKVTATSYTREELKAYLEKMFALSSPERMFVEMQKTFEAFRVITKDQDIKQTILGLLTSQIAGFYDPATKQLRIISEAGASPTDNQANLMTLPHELVHAVTDQYYNLIRYQLTNFDDDISSSFTAVIEGDATLFGLKIAYGENFERLKNWLSSSIKMQPIDSKYPEFLYRYFLFPYSDGYEFVLNIFEKQGVEGVNKLYNNPPLSTEQILHPDKYGSDFPTQISINRGLTHELGKWLGLKKITSGVMGEVGIQLLLKHRKVPKFISLSRGWDGDKYIVYEHKDLGVCLLWVTVWDSDKDANEFSAYIIDAQSAFKGGKTMYHSIVEGNTVMVIENFPIPQGRHTDWDALPRQWLKQHISLKELKGIELFHPVLF